jgi:hypothetical protein
VSGRGLGATSAGAARDGACDSAGARPLIPADVQTQQVVGQVRRPNDQSVSVNCDRTSQLPRPSRRLRRPTPHPTPREQRTSAGWRAGSCRPMDTRPATCPTRTRNGPAPTAPESEGIRSHPRLRGPITATNSWIIDCLINDHPITTHDLEDYSTSRSTTAPSGPMRTPARNVSWNEPQHTGGHQRHKTRTERVVGRQKASAITTSTGLRRRERRFESCRGHYA